MRFYFIDWFRKHDFFSFSLANKYTNRRGEGSDYKPTYNHVPIVHKRDLIWTIAILLPTITQTWSFDATVKLLSLYWKITVSSSKKSLVCKKESKVVYNTLNNMTPYETLCTRVL